MRYVTLPLFGLLLVLLGGCQETAPIPSVPPEPPKPSFVVQLSDIDFLEKTRKGVVLLDAYAAWCLPCQIMEQHLEKVAETLQGKAMVARIDAEVNREFARLHRVQSFPTLFVFVDGKLVVSSPGARPEEELLELVKEYIDAPPTELPLTEPGPVVPSPQENL